MTIRYSQKSGNCNDNSVWNTAANGSGTFLAPIAGDACYIYGHTITITADPLAASFEEKAANSQLVVSGTVTVANPFYCSTQNGVSIPTGNSLTLNGVGNNFVSNNVTGGGTFTLSAGKTTYFAGTCVWSVANLSIACICYRNGVSSLSISSAACSITGDLRAYNTSTITFKSGCVATVQSGGVLNLLSSSGFVVVEAGATLYVTATGGVAIQAGSLTVNSGGTYTIDYTGYEFVYTNTTAPFIFDSNANVTRYGVALLPSVDPGVANVWTGVAYKSRGSSLTGTKRASSITNCTAGNIKAGVTIDDVTGTAGGLLLPRPMNGGYSG